MIYPLFSCFIFAKELLNDHIHCITDGSDAVGNQIPERAFDAYCYISDTFTLPRTMTDGKELDLPHPGVGPIGSNPSHQLLYHNYYMWVPYLLLIQSCTFFIPLLLHRFAQEGRVQLLLAGLHNLIAFDETREDKYGDIKLYMKDFYNHHDWWAFKLFFCDALNLVSIILNILFTNWYLGNTFYEYGAYSIGTNLGLGHIIVLMYVLADYMIQSMERKANDPFNIVFPKMTKCTLETYGPSGTIQNNDGLCVLPINVLNEKIYFIIWFIFFALALFTLIHHIVAFVIIVTDSLRFNRIMIIKDLKFTDFFRTWVLMLYVSPDRKDLRRKLNRILKLTSWGDWLMLFMLAKNTDRVTFSQILINVKQPDWRFDLEPSDKINVDIDKQWELPPDDNDNLSMEMMPLQNKAYSE